MPTVTLGQLLRGHRRDTGLTLEALAARSEVSVRAISDIERGRSLEPQMRTVRALADALELGEADRAELYETSRMPASTSDRAPLCPLPPDLPDFVGRAAELDHLAGLLREGTRTVVVSGAGGIGKTVLSVRAACSTPDPGIDGRFFVDLRGLDDEPLDPGVVQGLLLRATGTDPAAVPEDPADLYRRTLAERPGLLLLLDNAADEAQVRPLLPDDGRTTLLITSRRALTGLTGAVQMRTGPLTDGDAAELLRSIVGAGDEDEERLAEVARLCGNYPLALRIAGGRMLTRPGWTLATLAERLRDPDRRLDRLAAGDLRMGDAFAGSYDRLTPGGRLVLRGLATLADAEPGAADVAEATGLPPAEAEIRLDELIEAGLARPLSGRRYGLHVLVRLFALVEARRTDCGRGPATT